MQQLLSLFSNVTELTWQMPVMWAIGAILIYLGIVKKMEPALLVPMGFGAILVNLPLSGARDPDRQDHRGDRGGRYRRPV